MHVGLRLDPRHDFVPAKAAVAPHEDAGVFAETPANGGDYLFEPFGKLRISDASIVPSEPSRSAVRNCAQSGMSPQKQYSGR